MTTELRELLDRLLPTVAEVAGEHGSLIRIVEHREDCISITAYNGARPVCLECGELVEPPETTPQISGFGADTRTACVGVIVLNVCETCDKIADVARGPHAQA